MEKTFTGAENWRTQTAPTTLKTIEKKERNKGLVKATFQFEKEKNCNEISIPEFRRG